MVFQIIEGSQVGSYRHEMKNPVEIQILNKRISAVAEEMGIVLQRSALSANIKERRDFSCAVFDGKGRILGQAAHIPVHLGAMPDTITKIRRKFCLKPGEIVITNDPFAGGTHLPDITLIAPVFPAEIEQGVHGDDIRKQLAHENEKQYHDSVQDPDFYLVVRAHHADVGGKYPGSMSLTRSLEDEGVYISPGIIGKGWQFDQDRLLAIVSRMRGPSEREGDLRAQLAALKRGRSRLLSIMEQQDRSTFLDGITGLLSYGRRFMEATIARIPDGIYRFTDFLDDDGADSEKLPISVTLTVNGKEVIVDFSESADQAVTCLNATRSVTCSAVYYCFFCLVGEGYPVNSGSLEPVKIITRAGSLLDPLPPAPVAAGNVETSQRIVDALFGALVQAIPSRIPAASCGSMNNVAIGGIDDASGEFTYYETIGGGMGARPDSNGLSGVQVHMTNTLNTPVEALEQIYPFIIERYGLRRGSGGAGKNRGGDGIIRSYRFLKDVSVSLLTERRRLSPYGLSGGSPGKTGENLLISQGRDALEAQKLLPGKCQFQAAAGDVLEIRTPGGGGFGSSNPSRP